MPFQQGSSLLETCVRGSLGGSRMLAGSLLEAATVCFWKRGAAVFFRLFWRSGSYLVSRFSFF